MSPVEPTAAEAAALMAEMSAGACDLVPPIVPGTGPATPPAYVKPASTLTADLTGANKQPGLSSSEAAQMRDALIKSGVSPGAVDAALKADNIDIPVTPPTDETRTVLDPLVYRPDLTRFAHDRPIERTAQVLGEMTQWASDMKLSPAIGNAVIEHVAELGPRFAAMNDEARAAWIREQEAIGQRIAKSVAGYAALKAKAAAVLKAAEGTPLGKVSASHPALLNSHWLVSILNTFAPAV